MNTKDLLTDLFSDIEDVKKRTVSAGTKFRLMALVADIAEVAQGLQQRVLQRVSQEAVLDADEDTDYVELAEQVLAMELAEAADAEEIVGEQTRLVNEALGVLGDTLAEVDRQLSRHHKDEEYARLYEQEKLLAEEWFSVLVSDDKKYTTTWTDDFVEALMHSEWGEQIAREWAVRDKRLTLKCMIIGLLKDAGVLKGSYNQIAKLLDLDGENPATLAKYLGMGKKQPYAEWIEQYVMGE